MQLSAGCSKGHHTLYLNVNERIPSDYLSTNKTIVDWSLQLYVSSYNFYYMRALREVVIDGRTVYSNNDRPDCNTKYQTYTLASGSEEITHNSDGKKTISVSAKWEDIDTASYTPGTAYISGSMTLTTIPRVTSCPNLTGNVESSYTIALNPASSSFIVILTAKNRLEH